MLQGRQLKLSAQSLINCRRIGLLSSHIGGIIQIATHVMRALDRRGARSVEFLITVHSFPHSPQLETNFLRYT